MHRKRSQTTWMSGTAQRQWAATQASTSPADTAVGNVVEWRGWGGVLSLLFPATPVPSWRGDTI